MKNLEILTAQPQDAEGVVEVHLASWLTTYSQFFEPEVFQRREANKSASIEYRKNEFSNDANGVTKIAKIDDKIVGFASAHWQTRQPNFDGVAEISAIYLFQENQRQGIGTKLLKAVIDELKARNISKFIVGVLKQNPSRNFYIDKGGKLIFETQLTIGTKTFAEEYYMFEI